MALLVLSPSLSLHDACVISFFLSNTNIQPSFIKFFLPVSSSLFISITRSNHSYLIHSFPLTPILSNFHIHSPIPPSSLFLLSKKTKTTNHAFPPFPPPGSTSPSTPTTVPAPSPLHNSKQYSHRPHTRLGCNIIPLRHCKFKKASPHNTK